MDGVGLFGGDCDGAVEGCALLAEVLMEVVGVVDDDGELVGLNAVAEKNLLDAGSAVLAEAGVDGIGAGEVVGPAGNDVLGVGVGGHFGSTLPNT